MNREIRIHKLDCMDEETKDLLGQIDALQKRIRARAQDLYLERVGQGDGAWGDSVGDWLRAEREVSWTPVQEMEETDRSLSVRLFELPEAPIEVMVLPEMILLRNGAAGQSSKALAQQIVFPARIHPRSAVVRLDEDGLTVLAAKAGLA